MPATAYRPYAPLDALKPVAPNIWIVDGPEIGLRFAGVAMPFPTRMTIVRLPGGALWVHSPTMPSDDLFRSVAGVGLVRYLIAPNSLHYWWLPEWRRRFPEAAVFGVPGLERSAKRPLPPFTPLQDAAPPDWAGVIDQVLIPGDVISEADFFHRPSRTLILTDLIENFEASRVVRPWLRWLIRWSGAADPDGKAPIDLQLSFLRHRRRTRAAIQRMIDWSPERVVIAHGRWYASNAVEELRRAFRWIL